MRPNLLFILVDSAQAGAYRLNGGAAAAPALERLAAEGVNCPRAWSVTPICHPARSCLITGLHAHANGMLTNAAFASGWPFTVSREVPTLPELLREQGYRTGYAGQMHIVIPGWDDDRHQTTRDYQRWLRAAGWEEAAAPERRGFHCGPVEYDLEHTREAQFAARGLELLDDLCRRGGPWFMQLDFDGPHPSCWLPEPYASLHDAASLPLPTTLRDDLAGRPDWVRMARDRSGSQQRTDAEWRQFNAYYHAEITMIDHLVGRLLDRLDHHGVAENTVVVFTSDHATAVGYHGFAMHGGPALYEEVLRVPAVVRWPAGLPAGLVCQQTIEHVDLVPTLLEAAGAPAVASHGESALAALRGEQRDHSDTSFHTYHGTGAMFFSVRAWRDGDWKLIYTPFAAAELYHLASDPLETVNLAGQPAAAEAEGRLRAGLLAELERVGDPLRRYCRADLQP